MHIYSKAVDFFVVGLAPGILSRVAWCAGKGSVGVYPHIKFPEHYIHLDTRDLMPGARRAHWGFTPPNCEIKPEMELTAGR